jgi:hypothetical protein
MACVGPNSVPFVLMFWSRLGASSPKPSRPQQQSPYNRRALSSTPDSEVGRFLPEASEGFDRHPSVHRDAPTLG